MKNLLLIVVSIPERFGLEPVSCFVLLGAVIGIIGGKLFFRYSKVPGYFFFPLTVLMLMFILGYHTAGEENATLRTLPFIVSLPCIVTFFITVLYLNIRPKRSLVMVKITKRSL